MCQHGKPLHLLTSTSTLHAPLPKSLPLELLTKVPFPPIPGRMNFFPSCHYSEMWPCDLVPANEMGIEVMCAISPVAWNQRALSASRPKEPGFPKHLVEEGHLHGIVSKRYASIVTLDLVHFGAYWLLQLNLS